MHSAHVVLVVCFRPQKSKQPKETKEKKPRQGGMLVFVSFLDTRTNITKQFDESAVTMRLPACEWFDYFSALLIV